MWLNLCNQHSKLLFSNNVTQGIDPALHIVTVWALDLLEDLLRKQECSKAHIMLLLKKASSDIQQRLFNNVIPSPRRSPTSRPMVKACW